MIKFEDKYDIIIQEIEKRRYKWRLKAIAWMDFEDVSQLLLFHIYRKWHLWDQEKTLLPWVNTIISHQMINMLRNLYMSVARPCISCSANEGGDKCRIYSEQCSKCPLFAKWELTKKRAHDVKLPVTIENHLQETYEIPDESEDLEGKGEYLHKRMKEVLTPIQYRVYSYIYIDNKTEQEAAKLMGYKTTEKSRSPGYKQIQNMQKIFLEKAKKIISQEMY